jgi:hypothetical protein
MMGSSSPSNHGAVTTPTDGRTLARCGGSGSGGSGSGIFNSAIFGGITLDATPAPASASPAYAPGQGHGLGQLVQLSRDNNAIIMSPLSPGGRGGGGGSSGSRSAAELVQLGFNAAHEGARMEDERKRARELHDHEMAVCKNDLEHKIAMQQQELAQASELHKRKIEDQYPTKTKKKTQDEGEKLPETEQL